MIGTGELASRDELFIVGGLLVSCLPVALLKKRRAIVMANGAAAGSSS